MSASTFLKRQSSFRPAKKPATHLHIDPRDEAEGVEASWEAIDEHALAVDIAAARPDAKPSNEKLSPVNSASSVLPKRLAEVIEIKYRDASNRSRISRIKAALLVTDTNEGDELDPRIFDDPEFVRRLRDSSRNKYALGGYYTGSDATDEEKRARDEQMDRNHRRIVAQNSGKSYRVEKPSAKTINIFASVVEELSDRNGVERSSRLESTVGPSFDLPLRPLPC